MGTGGVIPHPGRSIEINLIPDDWHIWSIVSLQSSHFLSSYGRWTGDIPIGTANHLEHTAGGMNKTGHPSGSPIWLNDTVMEVLGQVIFCVKRGEEKYVCSSSCPVSGLCEGFSAILWLYEWGEIKYTLAELHAPKGSWMKCNWGRGSAFRPRGMHSSKVVAYLIHYWVHLQPQVAYTSASYPSYCISALLHPLPEIIVFCPSAPMHGEGRKTYYSPDTPIHSLSIPNHPKLLLLSSLALHLYFPPYQHRAPTTLPLLDSFGLCSLLFGSLLPEYRMKLGGACSYLSVFRSLLLSMLREEGEGMTDRS